MPLEPGLSLERKNMKNRIVWLLPSLLFTGLLLPSVPSFAGRKAETGAAAPLRLNSKIQLHPEKIPGSPENLKMRIEQLEKNIKILQRTMNATKKEVGQLRDELSRSLKLDAPPICADVYHSKRPGTGASVSCSPYGCEPSSGLCRTRCTGSADCAPKFFCDTTVSQCVPSQYQ